MADELDFPTEHLSDEQVGFILGATAVLGTLYMADQVHGWGKAKVKEEMAKWLAEELPKLQGAKK